MVSLRLPDSEEYIEARSRALDAGLSPTRSSNFTPRRFLVNSLLVDFVMDALVTNSTPTPDPNSEPTNQTIPYLYYRHTVAMTVVYCIAYLIVFLVGLVGNVFVIMVVYRSPRMRNVTNFFIVNLAVADILVIVFCLPATLMGNIFVPWVLGWWMCKTVPYVQGVSVAASVYSLIAVTLDSFSFYGRGYDHGDTMIPSIEAYAEIINRFVKFASKGEDGTIATSIVLLVPSCLFLEFRQELDPFILCSSGVPVISSKFLAIWWPLKCQITTRRARLMILVIWIIALTTTIPWALFFDLVVIFADEPDVKICAEVWPDFLNGSLYFLIANLLFCYILPMILISMCYVLIWIKVCKRHIPSDSKDAQMERMQQKSKVKVVKMLVVVVILFVLSWLPLYLIFARIKLGGDFAPWEEELLSVATPVAQWLGSSNSCINPILYAFFNNKYRRGFAAIVKSRKCCGTLRYYDSVVRANSSSTSLRKSSYYITNNNSSTRRQLSQDTNVSYISNNSGV